MNIYFSGTFCIYKRIIMGIIKDPCISVCRYDDKEICIGCRRTKTEAKTWWRMRDEEKITVLENLKNRSTSSNDHLDYYV